MIATMKALSAPAIAATLTIASLVASSDASAGGSRHASVVVVEPAPVSRNLPRSGGRGLCLIATATTPTTNAITTSGSQGKWHPYPADVPLTTSGSERRHESV